MNNYHCHQKEMLGDIFLELVSDERIEGGEIARIILDELEDIHLYHTMQAEKAAIAIEALGGRLP